MYFHQEDAAVSQLLLDTLKPQANTTSNIVIIGNTSMDFITRVQDLCPKAHVHAFQAGQNWWLGDFHGVLQQFLQDLPEQSVDCLLLKDFMQLQDHSIAWLQAARRVLSPQATVIANIKNNQHHQYIQQLLSQNSHNYTTVKFGNVAKLSLMEGIKVFLDAGMLPYLNGSLPQVADDAFITSLQAALNLLGMQERISKTRLNQLQYIFTAQILPERLQNPVAEPCSVLCATNNALQYQNNLAVSPDLLQENTPHQLLALSNAPNIAAAFAEGIKHCEHTWIVLAHQDVYLPQGWLADIQHAWHAAEQKLGHAIGVAGVAGMIQNAAGNFDFAGCAMDRIYTFHHSADQLPAQAHSLDELVLVYRRDRFIPELNPELGFHYYATDSVFKAEAAGLVGAILPVPCLHNTSRYDTTDNDADVQQKSQIFRQTWQHRLPIRTTIAHLTHDGCQYY